MLSDQKTYLNVFWDDMIGINAIVFGHHDFDMLKILQRVTELLPSDTIFCDIGANVGMLSLWVLSHASCTAIAFEPNPDCLRLLESSIERNGFGDRITVNPYALGSRPGTSALAIDPKNIGHAVVKAEGSGHRIQVCRLDDVISADTWRRCRLVKMDVEGYELEVLKGAVERFTEHRPILIFEVNREQLAEQHMSPSDLGDWLRTCGYTAFHAVGPVLYPPENGVYPVANIVAVDRSHDAIMGQLRVDANYRCVPRKFLPVEPLVI